jgi:hypothetical protein
LVQVQPSATFTTASPLMHGYRLDLPVKFSWAFAEPRPVTLEILLQDRAGVTASASFGGAFSVVSTLAFGGPLQIQRSDGAVVSPGQFVRAGDSLSWRGGHLVYTGTTIVPPVGEIRASIASESGPATALTFNGSTGDLQGAHLVKAVEDPSDLHSVAVRGTSGELLAQVSVPIGVDATAPAFGSTSVASGTRLTENPAVISVGVTDVMSGVGPGGVEWASAASSSTGFANWQRAEVSSGTDVVAAASVPLSEGVLTWVQFRARDLVGNGFTYSVPLNVTLDYGEVFFGQVAPVPESWSRSSEVPLTVSIANDRAVPLDFSTLEYLVIAGQSGLWTNAGMTGRGTSFDFTTTLGLPDGPRNALYLRLRLADRPETYQSPPFYLQVDTRPVGIELVGPSPSLWVTGGMATSTVLITDSASGPLSTSIRYRFMAQGTEMWSPWTEPSLEPTPGGFRAKGIVPVNDGVDNFVVWKAYDVAGNAEVTSLYQRILADSRSVGFERPVPGDGARLDSISRVSIDVTDGDGSGVDLSTVEYKVDLPGGTSTGWRPAGRDGLVTRATMYVQVALPVGTSVLTWRAQDAAGTAAGVSFPIHLTVLPSAAASASPRVRLASPVSGVHYSVGADIKFDAASSADPDGRTLSFRWSLDGALLSETEGLFWMRLAPGDHTLTVVVDDGASPPVSKTVRFTVDGSSGPPLPFSSPAERGMLATLAGLLGGAMAVRLWATRARRDLRR